MGCFLGVKCLKERSLCLVIIIIGGIEMKLSEMKENSHGTVSSMGTDERFLKRITSIGLTEGARFQVVKDDPQGDRLCGFFSYTQGHV